MRVYNIIKKTVLFIAAAVLTAASSDAAQSVLFGIDIRKNNKNNADIILNLDKNTQVQKETVSQNVLNIQLHPAVLAEEAGIVYDNAAGVDSVIIQKQNNNNILVVIEGVNISKADVLIRNTASAAPHKLVQNDFIFGIDKKLPLLSAAGLAVLLIMIRRAGRKQNIRAYSKAKKTSVLYNNMRQSSITPLHAARTPAGLGRCGVSAPEKFIINRYMQTERIKKAC